MKLSPGTRNSRHQHISQDSGMGHVSLMIIIPTCPFFYDLKKDPNIFWTLFHLFWSISGHDDVSVNRGHLFLSSFMFQDSIKFRISPSIWFLTAYKFTYIFSEYTGNNLRVDRILSHQLPHIHRKVSKHKKFHVLFWFFKINSNNVPNLLIDCVFIQFISFDWESCYFHLQLSPPHISWA